MRQIDRNQSVEVVDFIEANIGVNKATIGDEPVPKAFQIGKFGAVVPKVVHDQKRRDDFEPLPLGDIVHRADEKPDIQR